VKSWCRRRRRRCGRGRGASDQSGPSALAVAAAEPAASGAAACLGAASGSRATQHLVGHEPLPEYPSTRCSFLLPGGGGGGGHVRERFCSAIKPGSGGCDLVSALGISRAKGASCFEERGVAVSSSAGRAPHGREPPRAAPSHGKTHAELVAEARHDANEPLSIGGWVPPAVALPAEGGPGVSGDDSGGESEDSDLGTGPGGSGGDSAQRAEGGEEVGQAGGIGGGLVAYSEGSSSDSDGSGSDSDAGGGRPEPPRIVSFF
jgi:hypothetical protein